MANYTLDAMINVVNYLKSLDMLGCELPPYDTKRAYLEFLEITAFHGKIKHICCIYYVT